ncbi:MAG: GNAT family N-acetyltransferase [Lachnospiraceae bacterium]|nr:GNAT family N-acetyltransferase [Lachnospiraceae bacterium]
MITIKRIDHEHRADINLKNEPFPLFGLLLPSYSNGKWNYTEIRFPKENHTEMCFPDENYDYDAMSDEHVFIGAYDEERCIGLAILKQDWVKYMYLYDLKVNSDYRGRGVGKMLIEKSLETAAAHGYRGLYTQGQDNNLGACQFYLNCGFQIGGINTFVYNGTSQENKKDIFFFCDAT